MVIHGREVRFLRTVGASIKIIDNLAGGDTGKVRSMFEGGYSKSQNTCAKFMAYLSEGYEQNQAFEDDKHEPRPLTREEALTMNEIDFAQAFDEALEAWLGQKETVEAEPVKKKERQTKSN